MNIFYLDKNPELCAQYHCDKHVVKMIIEYAQLLSTAHRILDGQEFIDNSSGRKIKRWKLSDNRELMLYKASHINHPSNVWARTSSGNYIWLLTLWKFLLKEYTHRYGKQHKTGELEFVLTRIPDNIPMQNMQDPPLAMPEECKTYDAMSSYRQYYTMKKYAFAKWTNRKIPEWYSNGILDLLVYDNQVMGLYD